MNKNLAFGSKGSYNSLAGGVRPFGTKEEHAMKTITIRFDADGEYRVPGPDGTEAQASYHDDREDAIGTAKLVHGDVAIRFRKVDYADPDVV